MASYHGPTGGSDASMLCAPMAPGHCCRLSLSPVGMAGECCDPFGSVGAQTADLAAQFTCPALSPHGSDLSPFDFSTAEINRNLDLLTENVTKLAIDG